MARLAIFVDGGYIDALARYEFDGARIDFLKLSSDIQKMIGGATSEPVDLLRAFYYHCPPYQSNPPTTEESSRYGEFRKFEDALRRLPRFEVRLGRLQFQGMSSEGRPIFQQKRIDLQLGLDIALLSGKGQVQQVALVAGDGDFIPAVRVVKQESVSVWLFHGPRRGKNGNSTYSLELWQEADDRVEIDRDFIGKVSR